MMSSMIRFNVRLLAQRRPLCNLALATALLTANLVSGQTPPPQASVATLESSDLEGFAAQSPEIQKRLLAALALTKLNLTYLVNSHDPQKGGMDCSGAIYHLLQSLGHHDIPRQSDEMAEWIIKRGTWTPTPSPHEVTDPIFSKLNPGDLLFWSSLDAPKDRHLPITHVMLYLGRHSVTGKRLLFGSSDGRSYVGERRSGVSVFDFSLPKANSKTALFGYGRLPSAPTLKPTEPATAQGTKGGPNQR
jgi:cell wall-associated NlpC family hydrolase